MCRKRKAKSSRWDPLSKGVKKAMVVLERIDEEDFENTKRYFTRCTNRDIDFTKYQDDSSSDWEEADQMPLNSLRQESSSDWEEADQIPLNCLRQESSSDWEEADQIPLNCLRQESSSDWEEADQIPLNCLRQESSSDWEEADQIPLNCIKQESSSDWEEADQIPLNCLRQDISTPEEDEENDEIVIIDSIWGEDYSELETIEVTEQIVPHNRNIWIERLNNLQSCATYSDLEQMALNLSQHLEPMEENLKMFLDEKDEIDYVALKFHPHEVEHLTPIKSIADGNCFPRSLSMLIYGNQRSHVEMHVRIIVEGAVNKNKYLNNGYLSINSCEDLVSQYCLYSGSLVPCNRLTHESICTTYENELMTIRRDGSYMGIWQFHQAANVLRRPIGSVYPEGTNATVRHHINKIILPFEKCLAEKQPLFIQWTPLHITCKAYQVKHFIPLMFR